MRVGFRPDRHRLDATCQRASSRPEPAPVSDSCVGHQFRVGFSLRDMRWELLQEVAAVSATKRDGGAETLVARFRRRRDGFREMRLTRRGPRGTGAAAASVSRDLDRDDLSPPSHNPSSQPLLLRLLFGPGGPAGSIEELRVATPGPPSSVVRTRGTESLRQGTLRPSLQPRPAAPAGRVLPFPGAGAPGPPASASLRPCALRP